MLNNVALQNVPSPHNCEMKYDNGYVPALLAKIQVYSKLPFIQITFIRKLRYPNKFFDFFFTTSTLVSICTCLRLESCNCRCLFTFFGSLLLITALARVKSSNVVKSCVCAFSIQHISMRSVLALHALTQSAKWNSIVTVALM